MSKENSPTPPPPPPTGAPSAPPAPPPPDGPPKDPPPAAQIVLEGRKTERELDLERQVEEERHGRKRAETRSAYLEDENYRLRAAGLTPAPVQPPAPPAPAAEDDDGPLSWYSFGKR